MARFKTTDRDHREIKLSFALILFDQFTQQNRLLGKIIVRLADHPVEKPFLPLQKQPDAVFVFLQLKDGDYVAMIASDEFTPYYRKAIISLTLPMPNESWPAFPNVTLADFSLPLNDPAQPQAYRVQRQLATLKPTTAYPFPEGATLLRGTVRAGGKPLSGAIIEVVGADLDYETAEGGDFVVFFAHPKEATNILTVLATHPLHAPVQKSIKIIRGMTVISDFVMV